MTESQLFRYQCIDNSGLISGALIHFRQGRAPGSVFTDKSMKIPGRNPLPANSRGVAVAYLPVGEEFEVTVTRPDGSFVEQFDHTATPMSGETVIEPAPEPEVIEKIVEVEKVVEVPVEVEVVREVENTTRLNELEGRLKAALDALNERPETVIPDFEPKPAQESYDEPPAEIADLIDPDLTARQNLDALTAKFAAAKNMEEYCRSNGDMESAMKHLRDADRFESGIKWNRAVLAEVM